MLTEILTAVPGTCGPGTRHVATRSSHFRLASLRGRVATFGLPLQLPANRDTRHRGRRAGLKLLTSRIMPAGVTQELPLSVHLQRLRPMGTLDIADTTSGGVGQS